MVTVYYRKSIPIKISQEKKHIGRDKEVSNAELHSSLPVEPGHVTFLAPMCDNTCRDLPISRAHPSLGVQSFYLWLYYIGMID